MSDDSRGRLLTDRESNQVRIGIGLFFLIIGLIVCFIFFPKIDFDSVKFSFQPYETTTATIIWKKKRGFQKEQIRKVSSIITDIVLTEAISKVMLIQEEKSFLLAIW